MSQIEIKMEERGGCEWWPDKSDIKAVDGMTSALSAQPTRILATFSGPNYITWHIPRPSLVGHSEKSSDNNISSVHYNRYRSSSPSSYVSSQCSTTSIHSIASGTSLLTTANLANFTAMQQQPIVTPTKSLDSASVASSTHFTVINGLGRSNITNKKSWCARNQLTFLVCTMCVLFMIGLLSVILYMEMRVRDKYD